MRFTNAARILISEIIDEIDRKILKANHQALAKARFENPPKLRALDLEMNSMLRKCQRSGSIDKYSTSK